MVSMEAAHSLLHSQPSIAFEDLVNDSKWPPYPDSPLHLKGYLDTWADGARAGSSARSSRTSAAGAPRRLSEPFREPQCSRAAKSEEATTAGTESCTLLQPVDRKGDWQEIWRAFDQLERVWCTGEAPGKISMLQHLFALLSNVEMQIGQRDVEMDRERCRRMRALNPFIQTATSSHITHIMSAVMSAWRLAASRTAQADFRNQISDAVANHTLAKRSSAGLLACSELHTRQKQRKHVRTILIVWRLWVRGMLGLHIVCQRIERASRSKSWLVQMCWLKDVLVEWCRHIITVKEDRWKRQQEALHESLKQQLHAQQEANLRLTKKVETLTRHHRNLGEQYSEAQRHMESLRSFCLIGESDMQEGGSSMPAFGSNHAALETRKRQMSALQQERQDVIADLREIAEQSSLLVDRLEHAQETAEILKLRLEGKTHSVSNCSLYQDDSTHRQLSEVLRAHQEMEAGLNQLHAREARLRSNLEDTDRAIEELSAKPVESLKDLLHNLHSHYEAKLKSEHSRISDLKLTLERVERAAEQEKAEHTAEQQRWQDNLRAFKVQSDSELFSRHQEVQEFQQQLWEAQTWIEHLKEISETKLEGKKHMEAQESQLSGIKRALSDLTDISAKFLETGSQSAADKTGGPASAAVCIDVDKSQYAPISRTPHLSGDPHASWIKVPSSSKLESDGMMAAMASCSPLLQHGCHPDMQLTASVPPTRVQLTPPSATCQGNSADPRPLLTSSAGTAVSPIPCGNSAPLAGKSLSDVACRTQTPLCNALGPPRSISPDARRAYTAPAPTQAAAVHPTSTWTSLIPPRTATGVSPGTMPILPIEQLLMQVPKSAPLAHHEPFPRLRSPSPQPGIRATLR